MPVITVHPVAQLVLVSLPFAAASSSHAEMRAQEHLPAAELFFAGTVILQVCWEDRL